jgi:signal transduction histidine kinase
MSHEIRTPLNAVLGMNELIMRETKDENVRKYSYNIQNAGKTLLGLINDVLDFSRIDTGKMEIIDDYFFNESGYKGEPKEDVVNGLDDLLIERHDHMCGKWLEKVQQSKGNDDVKKEENKEDNNNNNNTNNNTNVLLNSPKHSTTNNNLQSPSPKVSPQKSPLQTHSPPSPPSPPTPPSGGYSSGGDGEGSEGV